MFRDQWLQAQSLVLDVVAARGVVQEQYCLWITCQSRPDNRLCDGLLKNVSCTLGSVR